MAVDCRKVVVHCVAALVLLAGVSTSAEAQLAPDLIDQINAAVDQPDVDTAATAMAPNFNANTDLLTLLVGQATSHARTVNQIPDLCRAIMTTASSADPDQIGDVATAILDVAPECEAQVAAVLVEGVAPAAGPAAAPGASTGPTPSPISPPSSTAESPSTDVAGPTTIGG